MDPDLNVFHLKFRPMATEKMKIIFELLGIYLDSAANPVNLPRKWAKWAELAVMFDW